MVRLLLGECHIEFGLSIEIKKKSDEGKG